MWNLRSISPLVICLAATGAAPFAVAQHKVPFDSTFHIPVAPTGLASRPLPDHPLQFDTAEGQNIRVTVLAKGLEYPWALTFLPDGTMLVTERPGRIRKKIS